VLWNSNLTRNLHLTEFGDPMNNAVAPQKKRKTQLKYNFSARQTLAKIP